MTRFAKLTLLLIVAGALALAGCGGDDNGGLSAEDQARISAAEDAAAAADAAAKAAADKAAADAKAAEEKAAADKMAADAEIAAAKAAAEAAAQAAADAKAAADALKAEADAAKKAAADQAAADQAAADKAAADKAAADKAAADAKAAGETAVMAVWEAMFAPAVEKAFTDELSDNPTTAEIRDAIITLAGRYGVDPPNTLAGLDAELATFFGVAVPTTETARSYFQGLRSAGFLPASRDLALGVSPPADAARDEASAMDSAQTAAITALTKAVNDLAAAEKARQDAANKAVADAADAEAKAAAAAAAEDAEAAATRKIVDTVTAVLEQTGLIQSQAEMDAEAEQTAEAEAAIEANRQFVAAVTEVLEQAGLIKTQAEMDAEQDAADMDMANAEAVAALQAQLASLDIPMDTVDSVYEALAGPAIQEYFEGMLTPSMTRPQVVAAIAATAEHFGLDNAQVDAAVMYAFPLEHVNLLEDWVKVAFMAMREAGLLPATRASVIVAINDEAPGTTTTVMNGDDDDVPPGDDDDRPTGPAMTEVEYIDAIIDMDVDVLTMENGLEISDNENDYATSGLLGEVKPSAAKYGDNIRQFSALISKDGFAEVSMNAEVYGAWGKYNSFGSIADLTGLGNTASYSFGVEADAPTGNKGGSAVWRGTFLGHHNKSVTHDEADTTPATTGDMPDVMKGAMVSGRVELDVTFSDTRVADTMEATFDKFDTKALESVSHMITVDDIRGGGSFEAMEMKALHDDANTGRFATLTPAVGDTAAAFTPGTEDDPIMNMESSIEGQFYGPDGMEAGGVMKLVNGFAPDGKAILDAGDAGTAGVDTDPLSESYYITGAFGTEK